MNFLDSSFILDYLNEDREHHADAEAYLRENEGVAHGTSTAVLFEVYRGSVWPNGPAALKADRELLDWIEAVPLTDAAVADAARIDYELGQEGDPIGLFDTIIAGAVREAGGTIVTRDTGFERVPGLSVHNYADN